MKFEILKRNNLKRNIIVGVLVVGIISTCILTFTRAKYRTTESIPLVNGTVNYNLADLNIVAITIDGSEVDTIPDGNYKLTEESYCTVNGEKDSSIKLSYDSATKGLNIAPMTTKGTKCYLYFDKQKILKDMILANNTINSGTPDFSQIAITNEGIYKAEDDWGDSYYFRGSVNNNWLKFAGYYWRIIRINGDGSIRVIYNGTSTATTGSSTMINNGIYQTFNADYNRSEHVGYMYTSGEQHGNTTNSDIKTEVDNWYNSNLKNQESKISKEAGFCGDRKMATGSSWSSQPSSMIRYKAHERLSVNKSPSLKCSNSNDLYTVSGSSKGNKALTNPIGLITADEVAMAGGVNGKTNQSYYLYNNEHYWTMSPYSCDYGWAHEFLVYSNGNFQYRVPSTGGIRPVINLAPDVIAISGNGTSSTPYEI